MMGIHVSLVKNGEELPITTWDWIRVAGDREMWRMLWQVEHTTRGEMEDITIRPTDVEAFRTKLKAAMDYNHDRWDLLCDLLASDPEIFVYASH